jgi:hypothetical protein
LNIDLKVGGKMPLILGLSSARFSTLRISINFKSK